MSNVGGSNVYVGDGATGGGCRPHQQRSSPASGKLEPINERVISIQPATPTEYTAYYDDFDDNFGGISGNAGQKPVVGGLRHLFRRRSNADVTRLASQRNEATPGGSFSVSIGPSASGGGRLSLMVQQTSPGTRVNLVFPSSSNVGHSLVRGSDGTDRVSYSGPVNRSMPPSYEESVRGTALPSTRQHQHHHHHHHQRSPSLQDFSPAATAIFPGVIPHPHRQQQQQQQQQQLAVPGIRPNSGHSSPTVQTGYSQTLQVDTGLRQYQPSPTSSSSSSPRYPAPQLDLPTPSVVGQPPTGLFRSPLPLGRHLGDRQARLEQVRSRPHSGDLDLTTPGASGPQFNTGRSSSPLILAPIGRVNVFCLS